MVCGFLGLATTETRKSTMSQLLYRLGQLAARRHWRMIAAWVVIAAAVIGLSQTAGASFTNDYRVPGVESQRAADLLRGASRPWQADATIVFHAQRGTVRDPHARVGIAATLAELRRQPHIVAVDDPLDPRAGAISPDGSVAFASVRSDLHPGRSPRGVPRPGPGGRRRPPGRPGRGSSAARSSTSPANPRPARPSCSGSPPPCSSCWWPSGRWSRWACRSAPPWSGCWSGCQASPWSAPWWTSPPSRRCWP